MHGSFLCGSSSTPISDNEKQDSPKYAKCLSKTGDNISIRSTAALRAGERMREGRLDLEWQQLAGLSAAAAASQHT